MATNFESHEFWIPRFFVNFVQSKKIGTLKNKAIHSNFEL